MELLTPMNEHFKVNPPKQSDVIKIGIDICKALEVCQKYNIVHRDIKLDNILLTTKKNTNEHSPFNLEIKIGDYGFCRSINCGTEHGRVGTPVYLCPEIHHHSSPTITSDLYSQRTKSSKFSYTFILNHLQ